MAFWALWKRAAYEASVAELTTVGMTVVVVRIGPLTELVGLPGV